MLREAALADQGVGSVKDQEPQHLQDTYHALFQCTLKQYSKAWII